MVIYRHLSTRVVRGNQDGREGLITSRRARRSDEEACGAERPIGRDGRRAWRTGMFAMLMLAVPIFGQAAWGQRRNTDPPPAIPPAASAATDLNAADAASALNMASAVNAADAANPAAEPNAAAPILATSATPALDPNVAQNVASAASTANMATEAKATSAPARNTDAAPARSSVASPPANPPRSSGTDRSVASLRGSLPPSLDRWRAGPPMMPPSWEPGIDSGVDRPLGGWGEPAIAINPLNPLNIAVAGLVHIQVSIDGGRVWSVEARPAAAPGYEALGNPTLAFDSRGRLFWVHLGRDLTTRAFDLFCEEVDPRTGRVIAGPFRITPPQSPLVEHDKPWLAADWSLTSPFRDRLYVVWTSLPRVAGDQVRVLASFSQDQGRTWSAAQVLGTQTEGFVWPAHVTTAPSGEVYAVYHAQFFSAQGVPTGTSGSVFFVRSLNGGATWSGKTRPFPPGRADITFNEQDRPRGLIPGAKFWLQGSVQPWVLADPQIPGSIYVVANDDPDNDIDVGDHADVFFVRSTDSGATWSTPRRVDDGPGTTFQVMPTAAIDPVSGCIGVLWYDNRRQRRNPGGSFLLDVHWTVSIDRGLTWTPSVAMNDAAFDPDLGAVVRFPGPPPTLRIWEYIGIALSGGDLSGAWTGNTTTGQQVLFDRAPGACPRGCYPDCDGSGRLDAADFTCYQNRFALGDSYADCDFDGRFSVSDFTCFQNRYALGCP